MTKDTNRIKYALLLEGWSYEASNIRDLQFKAKQILPEEFHESMIGSIFCPKCNTPLSRSPKNKPIFSNSRQACFVHLPSYANVKCDLRTPKPEGLKYSTEELALQAIADDKLVIVTSFMKTPPERDTDPSTPYNQSAVEDSSGPISEIPISRHSGEFFKLPSKISTIAGICRKFNENLHKYYVLPGDTAAIQLICSLSSIKKIEEPDETPKIYWGEILSSHNAGIKPKPANLRMTRLACHSTVKDFYLKSIDSEQIEKGINDKSTGRIILLWGKITRNGIGLCIERPTWGEYALLPKKYEHLLK
jgi:hypothetical protein